MKLSSRIKPISDLKAHAAEIVRNLNEHREPLVITQNGEAKVVIQDIESYERTQETMALLPDTGSRRCCVSLVAGWFLSDRYERSISVML